MPEGDSYTYAAHRISPVLVDRRITSVQGSAPSVRRRSGELLDTTAAGVRTVGKHLFIDLDSGLTIHVHLGMSGAVRVSPTGQIPERGGIRLGLTTDRGSIYVLGAPTVEVDRRYVVDREVQHLGPDLLGREFDFELFAERSARYPDAASISDFLLDQRVMAGVGNEYKSEVLFLEGIAPTRAVESLDLRARERLAIRARALLGANAMRAVRSTTGRPDCSSWVYGRGGQPCRRCRTAISEEWVGEPPRITYWCGHCQK